MENNNPNNNSPTPMPLSTTLQQKLQLINVRINDLMLALNDVVTSLLKENQQLRTEAEKHKPQLPQTPPLDATQINPTPEQH
jgi:regulator of replication initiation timing